MGAEVRRDIADRQAAVGIGCILVGPLGRAKSAGVARRPMPVLGENGRCVVLRPVMETHKQVAVGAREIVAGPAVGGDRLVEPALLLQRDAEVDERAGAPRVDVERAAAGGDRLLELALGVQRFAQVFVDHQMIGLELEHAVIGGDRLLRPTLDSKRNAHVVLGLRPVGFDGDGAAVRCDGLVQPALFLKHDADIVVRVRVVGLQGDGAAVGREGLGHFALHAQGGAQAVVPVRMVRFELQNPAIGGDRLVQPAGGPVHLANVVVIHRVRRVGLDRPADQLERTFIVAGVMGHDTEQVQGVRMVRPSRKHASVGRVGLLQPASAVMRETFVQVGRERCRIGHLYPPRIRQRSIIIPSRRVNRNQSTVVRR